MSSFSEGEITVVFGSGTVGPAGPAGNAVPIAANTVLANNTGDLANPVGTSVADMRAMLSSVAYVSQTLTSPQQLQARINLGLDPMVTTESDVDSLLYVYYGGTKSGGWKVNRFDRTTFAKQSATISNNSGVANLAAAWAARQTTLVYG